MDRRDFLQTSFLGLGSAFFLSSCSTRVPYKTSGDKGHLYLGMSKSGLSSYVRMLNLNDFSFQELEIPLWMPHSLIRNKENPSQVFAFELLGSGVLMDFQTKQIVHRDHRKELQFFGGHAAQSGTDLGILSVEFQSDLTKIVRARSEKDLRPLDVDLSSFPVDHSIVRLPGTTIAVSSWGFPDKNKYFVTFYDYKKQQIVNQVECDNRLGHMMPLSATEVLGVSMNIAPAESYKKNITYQNYSAQNFQHFEKSLANFGSAPLYYVSVNGKISEHWDATQKDLYNGGFGVERVPSGDQLHLTGNYYSGTIIVWKNLQMEKVIKVPHPSGVVSSLDGREFFVLSEGTIKMYSTENYEFIKDIVYERPVTFINRYG